MSPAQILLIAALFLAPIIGGQYHTEPIPGSYLMAGLVGGPEAPYLSRALLGLLVFGSLGLSLWKTTSPMIPKWWMMASLAAVAFLPVTSLASTRFRTLALDEWWLWLLLPGAMLAAIAAGGRKQAPWAYAGAVLAGISVTGLRGMMEYLAIRGEIPGHRVFAGWSNPNAAAAILALGIALAVPFAMHKGRWQWLGWAGGLLSMSGLLLTQSKGGLLAAFIGGLGTLAMVAPLKDWKGMGKAALPLVAGALVFFALTMTAGGDGSRLANTGAEVEQSAGFRSRLWQTGAALAVENPLGYGPGSFRAHSAQPGLVEQTITAHQTYLHIAAENGVPALLALLWLAGLWLIKFLKQSKCLPDETRMLRAGIFGAILAAGASGFIESNLQLAGIGIAVFALLGIGLLVSSDGAGMELLPAPIRQAGVLAFCLGPIALLFLSARTEGAKSAAIAALQDPSVNPAAALAALPADGESNYYRALTSPPGSARLRLLRRAAADWPKTRALRLLAREEAAGGNTAEAIQALDEALAFDPNNLRTLELKRNLQYEAGQVDEATETASRLVDVEETGYFQIRALPELVPLQTYRARIFLAEQSPAEAQELLPLALEGFARYRDLTVPNIIRMKELPSGYGGQTVEDAQDAMQEGLELAEQLNQPEEAEKFREAVATL